jgi:LuxR family maltose regulon positive regulatory protein
MSGDLDTMEQWLRAAEAAIAAGAQDPNVAGEWADTEDLRMAPATISIYRASLAQARHDVPGPCATPARPWIWPVRRITSSVGKEAPS